MERSTGTRLRQRAAHAWHAYGRWPAWAKVVSIGTVVLVLVAVVGASGPSPDTSSELRTSAPTPRSGDAAQESPAPGSTDETPSPTATAEPETEGRDDPPAPAPETGTTSTAPSADERRSLLEQLRVATEGSRSGYDRGLFDHWTDADGDGCDTREEVLIEESRIPATTGSGCRVTGGEWLSAFDGRTFTNSSDLDVDHMVPLAEAWDSGAHGWSSSRREAFANDLGYAGSLIAVSASSNRSKGDRDPAEWTPSRDGYWCTYAATWVDVKLRWDLAADPAEVGALGSMLGTCAGAEPPPPPEPAETPTPTEAPPPDPTPAPTEAPSSEDCHPSYPDFCIPPAPPDLNCDDIDGNDFTVRHDVADPDPHRFDGNKDGVGCQS